MSTDTDIRAWTERLRLCGVSLVVQLEPADCRELAAAVAALTRQADAQREACKRALAALRGERAIWKEGLYDDREAAKRVDELIDEALAALESVLTSAQ